MCREVDDSDDVVQAFSEEYQDRCGLDWPASTYQQRYSPVNVQHDAAMRREIREYSAWLEEHMYVSTEDVNSRADLTWLKGLLQQQTSSYATVRKSIAVNVFDWYTTSGRHTYDLYRHKPGVTPISVVVYAEMCRKVAAIVHDAVRERSCSSVYGGEAAHS